MIRHLDELTDRPVSIDGKLSCKATLFQDYYHEKYMDGKMKNKFRKLVIRQMTKLRSGEVLYRDIGYVSLPIHTIVQRPHEIDSRLQITHPINLIDAFIDCSITVKFGSLLSVSPLATRQIHKSLSRTLSRFGIIEDGTPKKSKHT